MLLFQSFWGTYIPLVMSEINYPIQYKVIDWIILGWYKKKPKNSVKRSSSLLFSTMRMSKILMGNSSIDM